MRYRVVLPLGRAALRIGRVTLSLVAACGVALLGCGHPGGRGGPVTGNAGTTGAGGDVSPLGSAGTGGGAAGTTGAAGDGGPGNAGTTGNAGDGGPGAAGTTGAAGNGAAGTTGAAGDGAAGTTGSAGTSGSAGTTGSGGSGAGTNLIANGDFSDGATNWHTEQGGTGNVNNGAYCVTGLTSTTLVGWNAPTGTRLMLSSGTPYRVSFQASGAGTVHLKVGQDAGAFADIFTANHNVGSSLQTFTDNFTPTSNENAGIAFTFMNAGSSTVCIDNVTLAAAN
jgi:hypothetical protein